MAVVHSILKDIPVLICRPEPSATELANTLGAMGAQCRKLPCLDIKTLALSSDGKQKILDLDQYSTVIALSQYAAKPALALMEEYWPQPPVQQTWYAIGRTTANIIANNVDKLEEPTADLTSEELLELPGLQSFDNERVLILKGKDGRDTIEHALTARGATVDNLELYERVAPEYSNTEISQVFDGFTPRYIVALSGETVRNLKRFADQIGLDLGQQHLVVPSERVAQVAMQEGFKLTYIPNNLKPIDIIRCIAHVEAETKQGKR